VSCAKLSLALVATVAFAAVASGAAGAPTEPAKRATPKVTVADDFFAPDFVKVKKGKKVKWVWDDLNSNPHNVTLTSPKPKGVKKKDFKSRTGAVNIDFAPKFKKPGKYGFVCTIHRTVMKMTVQVKKR
jgi:plastocyanin